MVWMVQETLYLVQHNTKAGAVGGLDIRAKVVQKRLDLPPVDITADRILKNRAQQILMFGTHGKSRFFGKRVGDIAFVLFLLDQDIFQHSTQAIFLKRLSLADAFSVARNGIILAP